MLTADVTGVTKAADGSDKNGEGLAAFSATGFYSLAVKASDPAPLPHGSHPW